MKTGNFLGQHHPSVHQRMHVCDVVIIHIIHHTYIIIIIEHGACKGDERNGTITVPALILNLYSLLASSSLILPPPPPPPLGRLH